MSTASRRFGRAAALGLALGLGGVALSTLPLILDLDENLGLGGLFALRGAATAPDRVVVVSISGEAATAVGQSRELDTWPRELHAALIDRLSAAGAAAIAFDVTFLESREGDGDRLLADSILRAGNVLLAERIESAPVPLGDGAAGVRERRLLPLPQLKRGALGTAPFVLPKVPVRVGQFWTFGRATADTPSLPVVALQAYLLPYYAAFVDLVERTRPGVAADWPQTAGAIRAERRLDDTVQRIRAAFETDPALAAALQAALGSEAPANEEAAAIAVLLDLYAGPGSRYLNFYGPARSVPTVPYDRILGARDLDVAGKMVFVGFAETHQPEQQDDFYSVFSQRTGVNLSGVEVGATAFANLLGRRAVVPLSMPLHLLWVLSFGAVLGPLLDTLATRWAAAAAGGVLAVYLGHAYWQFADQHVWLPLVVPLLVQLPVAFAVVLWWNYRALVEQRERVHTALGHYVPPALARRLAQQSVALGDDRQLLHGTCLYTDAEQYTAVSEALRPDELAALMSDYYGALFRVVEQFGGEISDTAGDSMVAIWASAKPDAAARDRACRAALAILDAVAVFNRAHEGVQLPTRVGLESGELLLGSIGAEQRYEYRAIGDIVNTASRIQGLNRILGTRALVSSATLAGTSTTPARDVGTFLLRGKRLPVQVHEPLVLAPAAFGADSLSAFAAALEAFRRGDWGSARRAFGELAGRHADDGPSAYYHALATDYEHEPPPAWAGAIRIAVK
jgi:adenylate cyclase